MPLPPVNSPMDITELLTPRLRLRRARPDDLTAIHAVLSNAMAMRYWASPPHTDIGQSRAFLDGMIASRGGEGDEFVVEHQGQVIGKAGCWRVPEVGFIFHPDFWGRGLALEAMTAVVAHAFATYPVESLIADVDPRNRASLGLLRKLGFVETRRARRTIKVGEEWCDSVYLALRRP